MPIESDNRAVVDRRKALRRVLLILLASIFVLSVVSLIGFIWYVRNAAQNLPDVEVADKITAAGGAYQRDSIAPILCVVVDNWVLEYGDVIWVYYRTPLTVAKIEPLVKLRNLQRLSILPALGPTGTPVWPAVPSDPEAWQWLAKLGTLQELTIHTTDIRDEHLTHLVELKELRRLDLWVNANLTPAGVDKLRKARPDIHINHR